MFNKPAFCLLALLCLVCTLSHGQPVDSLTGKLTSFPSRLFGRIQSQTASMNQQLTSQTVKYLQRMGRQEEKLKSQLYKRDSVQAARLYPNDPKQQYAALAQKFKQDSTKTFTSMGPEYLPHADSTHGALAFLTKNPNLINANPALQGKMQGALTQMQQLQAKLQQADVIKQYIASRKAQIQQYLSTYSHLPSGITNTFQGYNKQAYYYADQVRQYRTMLNDPDKMMQTAIVLLNKVPAFTSFMQKNSFLSGLFGVPANYGTPQGLQGLQTRDQVMGMIKSQIGGGGGGGGWPIYEIAF